MTPRPELVLARTPTADARVLVAELDAALDAGYPPEQQHGLSLDEIFQPHVRFYIALLEGNAVGCGAIAMADGYAEIKRMYTRPATRGRGVGRAILARLEADARAQGLAWLRLETGDVLDAAMALYESSGFTRRGAFGPYLGKPARTIARSRFFEKKLA